MTDPLAPPEAAPPSAPPGAAPPSAPPEAAPPAVDHQAAATAATLAYRDAIRAANPAIPPAMIDGADIAAIAASVVTAAAFAAEAVRLAAAQSAAVTMPNPGAGAPPPADAGSAGGNIRAGLRAILHR